MNCPHCITGLMMADPYDGGERTCASCGRGTFHVDDPDALARQKDNERHIHGHWHLEAEARGREVGVPTGYLNPAIRRFR